MFMPRSPAEDDRKAREEEQRREACRNIERWTYNLVPPPLRRHGLDVYVQEIQCGDPNCSPIDTSITLLFMSGGRGMIGIPLEAKDVTREHIKQKFPSEETLTLWSMDTDARKKREERQRRAASKSIESWCLDPNKRKDDHEEDDDDDGPTPLFCLAVVRGDDNSGVDIYDAKGKLRSFRLTKTSADDLDNGVSAGEICYSTHGAGTDRLLTSCFDKNGEHGQPEKRCFCGIAEPHLHAHSYNPERCSDDDYHHHHHHHHDHQHHHSGYSHDSNGDCCFDTDKDFMAQLITLHPEDGGDKFLDEMVESRSSPITLPVDASLPNECNSMILKQYLSSNGLRQSHRIQRGNDDSSSMYRVTHGDHTDFLVRNESTDHLHLVHPCDTCKDKDVHGRFDLTASRRWMDGGGPGMDSKEIDLRFHFFQLRREPFRVLDCVAELFELESSRVHAVRAIDAVKDTNEGNHPSAPGRRIGRSQFYVGKICCASEIPCINSILNPIGGVVSVSVNTTTKIVYCDHDVDVVSACHIADALYDGGFESHIKKDAAEAMAQMSGIPTDVFVESKFEISAAKFDDDKARAVKTFLLTNIPEGQVQNINTNLPEKTLVVEHNPYYLTVSGIVAMLQKDGLDAKILLDGAADGMWALSLSLTKGDSSETIGRHRWTVKWSIILSGVFWVISMFSLIGGNWDYLKYVALLSVVFGLPPIARKSFATMKRWHFDANCLMLFAVVGAVALQEFTEAGAVTFLFAISESLESRATARARNALSAIVSLRPERANVINPITKEIVVLPSGAVTIGATVSVRAGDKIPCDGIVLEGESLVDESSLTGESRPVRKRPNSVVSGGTINTGSTQLVIKTTATTDNSAVARLIRLVEEAQANRSETEKLVDSFAKFYTPVVALTALCMCTIPWAFGRETGRFWTKNGLIAMVIACPCALIISTPVTYVAGLAAAAQQGVLIKGGAHLEALGYVKTVAFDKTGTLTEGIFALLHFNTIGDRPRKEVLEYLALMEAPASHPLSDAIVQGAANEQVAVPRHLSAQNHTILPGEGITAMVEGKQVYVGNENLFKRLGLYDDLPKTDAEVARSWARFGGTVGFISIEGNGIIGAYCVADKIRNEATAAVTSLKEKGIDIAMLTGDQRPAAIGIGEQIGLCREDVKSQLLPEDKMGFISNAVEASRTKRFCKAKRNVMMVGDGVNDAPALALADVSVAMGEGAAVAMETSDVTLMDSNLNKLLYIIRLGRRVVRTIVENMAFSLVTKAVVMGFTFAGRATLWAAIAADIGGMLAVTLNGMKLLPSSRKVKENELLASNEHEVRDDDARRKSYFKRMREKTYQSRGSDTRRSSYFRTMRRMTFIADKSAPLESILLGEDAALEFLHKFADDEESRDAKKFKTAKMGPSDPKKSGDAAEVEKIPTEEPYNRYGVESPRGEGKKRAAAASAVPDTLPATEPPSVGSARGRSVGERGAAVGGAGRTQSSPLRWPLPYMLLVPGAVSREKHPWSNYSCMSIKGSSRWRGECVIIPQGE